jgi:hypothetical protein
LREREHTPSQRELDAFVAGEPRWRPKRSVGPRQGSRRRGYRGREVRVVGDEALVLLDLFVGEAPHRRRRCYREGHEGCELDARDGGGTDLEEREELDPEVINGAEVPCRGGSRGPAAAAVGALFPDLTRQRY